MNLPSAENYHNLEHQNLMYNEWVSIPVSLYVLLMYHESNLFFIGSLVN